MNSVKELMDIFGYKPLGTCWCDGMKTLKFRKGDYEFRWRIHKYQFKLRNRGVTIKGWTSVKLAEEYLKTLHAQAV